MTHGMLLESWEGSVTEQMVCPTLPVTMVSTCHHGILHQVGWWCAKVMSSHTTNHANVYHWLTLPPHSFVWTAC